MRTLARSEWRRLWVRPFAWWLTAVVMAGMAWQLVLMLAPYLHQQSRLLASGADIGYTDVVLLPWLALFVPVATLVTPLASMNTLAGERRHGTLPLLLASGLSPTRIVLGKYLATVGWLLLLVAALVAMMALLSFSGPPDWGKLGAAVLGLVLLILTLAAIGVACSAWAGHPALAAAASLVISAALLLVGRASFHAGMVDQVVHWLALPTHLRPMGRGLVGSADIAWFLIVAALALALAIHRIGQERDRD